MSTTSVVVKFDYTTFDVLNDEYNRENITTDVKLAFKRALEYDITSEVSLGDELAHETRMHSVWVDGEAEECEVIHNVTAKVEVVMTTTPAASLSPVEAQQQLEADVWTVLGELAFDLNTDFTVNAA